MNQKLKFVENNYSTIPNCWTISNLYLFSIRELLIKILYYNEKYRVSWKSFYAWKLGFLYHILTKWGDLFTTDKGALLVHTHKKNVEKHWFGVQGVPRVNVKDLFFNTRASHWFNHNIITASFLQMFNMLSINFHALYLPAYSAVQHILKGCL